MLIPKLSAFCRIAPGERFIALEILTTGVLLLEWALRSRTCSFDQATRLLRPLVFFRLIAIDHILCEGAVCSTTRSYDKQFVERRHGRTVQLD